MGQVRSPTTDSAAECTAPASPPASWPACNALSKRAASQPSLLSNAVTMASITARLANRLPAATHCTPASALCVPSAWLPLNSAVRPWASTTATWRYWLKPLLLKPRSSAWSGDSLAARPSRICGPRAGKVMF
ncbi:hypothetical protein D3C75_1106980 [compost metagenome]